MKPGPTDSYDEQFFDHVTRHAISSANVLVPLALSMTAAKSVVDVGCGQGAWLKVFEQNGVTDYLGIDGDYVKRDELLIPAERFRPHDLTLPVALDRTFDLAVSLEVGEHLPESAGMQLVGSLTKLAPVVLFSAAIPQQGGTEHVNEQWPEYWAKLFDEHGYRAIDCIRPRLWNSPEVAWFYAQNTVLYASDGWLALHPEILKLPAFPNPPAPLVHPGLLKHKQAALDWIMGSPKALLRLAPGAFAAAVKRRLSH